MKHFDNITRRRFLQALAVAGGAAAIGSRNVTQAHEHPATQTASHPLPEGALPIGSERIAILIYPGFTELDAFGPKYALGGMMGAKVQLIAKTLAPVRAESGFDVTPNLSFDQLPDKLDLLIVPGGTLGMLEAIEDTQTLDFLRKAGGQSALIGSVCTGSLILGAAGLLDGYEATCHWQLLELLPLFGAKPSKARVVFDRNRVTGAGVTAGLDFGFELVRRYRGDFYAKGMQLLAQYDPHPPFPGGGDPSTADPQVLALLSSMHQPFVVKTANILRKAKSTNQ